MSFNVVILNFREPSKAYQALSELKVEGLDRRIGMQCAAVVERSLFGEFLVKDGVSEASLEPRPMTGVLMGPVIGILLGGLSLAFGTASGALVGSINGSNNRYGCLEMLDRVGMNIPKGHTSVVAVLEEVSPYVVDSIAIQLGASTVRRPLDRVEAEIALRHKEQKILNKKKRIKNSLMRPRMGAETLLR